MTRQVLSKLANQVYIEAVISFKKKNIDALHLHSSKFLQLIKDIDVLLASDDNFLLGTWLESAKKLAVNPNEIKQVRKNIYISLVSRCVHGRPAHKICLFRPYFFGPNVKRIFF